jgi:hypothetical protein
MFFKIVFGFYLGSPFSRKQNQKNNPKYQLNKATRVNRHSSKLAKRMKKD